MQVRHGFKIFKNGAIKISTLILSAWRQEASALLDALTNLGVAYEYFEVGIGPLNAARSEEKLFRLCPGKRVFYLGSAGCFYPFYEPHLVSIDRVSWATLGERLGLSQSPQGLYPSVDVSDLVDLGLPRRRMICAPDISLSGEIRFDLDEFGSARLVESMELYSCIQALKTAASLSIVMGITNQVGPTGRAQWRQNYAQVAQMSADFLIEHI